MKMTEQEVFEKLKEIIIEQLGVEDEVAITMEERTDRAHQGGKHYRLQL